MRTLLQHPEFLKLFAAQVLSLVAIGVMTVSLSLTAFNFGGVQFGGVLLGGILALKMVAYVLVAPLAEAVLSRYSRGTVLAGINMVRVLLVCAMVASGGALSIMVLSFLVFAASSAFTPLIQATIPDLLPSEALYTKALALSRIAYTAEEFLSPLVAGLALSIVAADALFFLPAIFFAASTVMVFLTSLPALSASAKAPFLTRLSRGARIYVRTPRLRGLWLVQFGLTLPLAWVLVNSVVYAGLHSPSPHILYPQLLVFFGIGTALGAVIVTLLIPRISERTVMVTGAFLFAGCGLMVMLPMELALAFSIWAGLGFASSLVLTPGGLVLTRSAEPHNRPALFAAQFALSHAGWLVAYPLAGTLGAWLGPEATMGVLAVICLGVAGSALLVWPADDSAMYEHSHPDLGEGHPHLRDHGSAYHRHHYFIDELHPHWPTHRG